MPIRDPRRGLPPNPPPTCDTRLHVWLAIQKRKWYLQTPVDSPAEATGLGGALEKGS